MPPTELDEIWRSARLGLERWTRPSPQHFTHDEEDAWVAGAGVQVADWNIGRVDAGADQVAFDGLVSFLDEADIPAMIVVAPGAATRLGEVAAERGIVDSGATAPVMVHDAPISVQPSSFEAGRATTVEDMREVAVLIEDAFEIPFEMNATVFGARLLDETDVPVWLVRSDGEPIGAVTATLADDRAGIWAMGTASGHQRRGAGQALLSFAMAEIRAMGIGSCFLFATPPGLPLYQRLGYRTVEEPRVWLRGHSTEFPS